MRRLLFAIALIGWGACGNDSGIDPGPDAPPVIDGKTEFLQNCATCHGPDGAGTNMGPQILDPVKPYATYVVRHGRNEMGYPGGMMLFDPTMLGDTQLNAILDWLASAPKPADGKGLYTRFCANCHGADARGGRTGKNIRLELGEVTQLVRLGHGGTSYGARTSYMPAWPATAITDAELTLIRNYVGTL